MTRAEYIKGYCQRNDMSDRYAHLGIIISPNNKTRVALPCACGANECLGWVMVSPEMVIDHLELYAPPKLREAYFAAVTEAGGV